MSFNLISTFLIAVALAMDAFSVSMTKGFTQKHLTKAQIFYYGLFFGGFQFIMPIFGYVCALTLSRVSRTVFDELYVITGTDTSGKFSFIFLYLLF